MVIYDETGFGADEIQQGTNDTSYLYARATRAVSLIPPAYYADLACERGRCYLNDFLVGNESDRGSSAGGRPDKEAEKRRVFEAAQKAWGHGVSCKVVLCAGVGAVFLNASHRFTRSFGIQCSIFDGKTGYRVQYKTK